MPAPPLSAAFVCDPDGRVLSWPPPAAALLGVPAAAAIGARLADVLGADLAAELAPRLAAGGPFPCATPAPPGRDPALRLHWHGEPLRAAASGTLLLVQAELPTADVEATHASVVAALHEGVVVQAADGRIASANAAAARILGLTLDQLVGRTSLDPHWQTVHADGTPFPGDQHPSMVALRTGQPVVGVLMGVHLPDGCLRWLSVNAQPIRRDAAAPPHAAVATFVDVTEAREQATRLQHSRQQLALVIEGSNDGFWDWHVPTGRVEFSSRWFTMLGYEPGELPGDLTTWDRLVHPDDKKHVMAVLSAHLCGETPFYETEHRMKAKNGSWVWILDRGKVVERDPQGLAIRAAGTHTDITPRRVVEEQLREALRRNVALVDELRAALDNVKTLSGLLPVCAWCKSVRDDRGYLQQIEHYLAANTHARFTHGLCPACNDKLGGAPAAPPPAP